MHKSPSRAPVRFASSSKRQRRDIEICGNLREPAFAGPGKWSRGCVTCPSTMLRAGSLTFWPWGSSDTNQLVRSEAADPAGAMRIENSRGGDLDISRPGRQTSFRRSSRPRIGGMLQTPTGALRETRGWSPALAAAATGGAYIGALLRGTVRLKNNVSLYIYPAGEYIFWPKWLWRSQKPRYFG